MRDDSIARKVREAIRKRGEKPVHERIADMVDRGVIDSKGNVLLRMPSAPGKHCTGPGGGRRKHKPKG